MLWDCDGHDSWVSCRAVECIVRTHVMIFEKILTRHFSQAGSHGTWMTITAVTESSHLYPYKRWNTTISQGERPIPALMGICLLLSTHLISVGHKPRKKDVVVGSCSTNGFSRKLPGIWKNGSSSLDQSPDPQMRRVAIYW